MTLTEQGASAPEAACPRYDSRRLLSGHGVASMNSHMATQYIRGTVVRTEVERSVDRVELRGCCTSRDDGDSASQEA